jgi:dihydroorotase
MALLIKNGRVVDPASDTDDLLDVLVENGKVKEVGKNLKADASVDEIDAKGLIVVPGLIDIHTHLREPGHEYKETIKTGSEAAAAGGFTTIACMANTNPVNDNASVTRYIINKAQNEACVNVLPIGAITKGLKGETLAEIGELKEAGVVALSDDGMTVRNSEVMRRGLEYARSFSVPVICHCEDTFLSGEGVMNEGVVSARLGLKEIPPMAEDIMVSRDILLSEWTGHPVHIAHVSTAGSVGIIRDAKARGVKITAETAPHFFSLTESSVESFNTSLKVSPPLGSDNDVKAVKEGLKDGTIDVIASDHAPHSTVEKDVEFDNAAFGMVGLETSLSLSLVLVKENILTFSQLIEKFTTNPSRVLNIDKGTLSKGADADITIIDPDAEYVVDKNLFKSKSNNSPFHGCSLKGRAVYTIVSGRVVFSH